MQSQEKVHQDSIFYWFYFPTALHCFFMKISSKLHKLQHSKEQWNISHPSLFNQQLGNNVLNGHLLEIDFLTFIKLFLHNVRCQKFYFLASAYNDSSCNEVTFIFATFSHPDYSGTVRTNGIRSSTTHSLSPQVTPIFYSRSSFHSAWSRHLSL